MLFNGLYAIFKQKLIINFVILNNNHDMRLPSIIQYIFKYLLFVFIVCSSFNCSAVIETVLNDNYLSDGEYIFLMYDSWGEKLITKGEMQFVTRADTTLTGYYQIQYQSDPSLNLSGDIIGTINKKDGKAEFAFGKNFFGDIKVKIDNNINLANGEWNDVLKKGRFVIFKKANLNSN